MAAAPASSIHLISSKLSLKGGADGTNGVRNFSPRYSVLDSWQYRN